MIKQFLYMLLIVMPNNVACSDIEPETSVITSWGSFNFEPYLGHAFFLHKLYRHYGREYFNHLTARQLAEYRRQIVAYKIIERSAWLGKPEELNWLILQRTEVKQSKALKYALKSTSCAEHVRPEIVSALLAAGATTEGLLIEKRPPLSYMKARLRKAHKWQKKHPGTYSVAELTGMQKVVGVLKEHEMTSKHC